MAVGPIDIVIAVVVAAFVVLIIRFMHVLLADLAHTPDEQLLMMTRKGWTAAIVFAFPIGAMLYLARGKIR